MEKAMSPANDVLECPPIQDTLFGDPKVQMFDDGDGPDSTCFCVCACKSREDRITDSQLTSAAAWVGR